MTNEQPPTPPLTRRQLRELRSTGANPIVTPEMAPEPTPVVSEPHVAEVPQPAEPVATAEVPPVVIPVWGTPVAPPEAPTASQDGSSPLTRRRVRERGQTDAVSLPSPTPGATEAEHPIAQAAAELAYPDAAERSTVSPQLGAALLSGASAVDQDVPVSFDQLISRTSSGSTSEARALIVTDSPPLGITAPVNATGEVLVTGSLTLPDLLATTGQMPGITDGLDIDGGFADGELPAHSSPTPIAASAAVSTVKTTADIIKPPAPEKGSRLMLALSLTAGALALALVGVLIVAITTGVFS